MLRLIGLGIVIASLGLMLPLPIPFSNNIPAWAVVLLAIGMMEKDGLLVLLGHLTAIATWIFIGLASVFAIGGFQRLLDSFLTFMKLDFTTAFTSRTPALHIATACLGSGTLFDALQIGL
jgi:hypothetical protein